MNKDLKGWMLPEDYPTNDCEVLILVLYARGLKDLELGFYDHSSSKWFYKLNSYDDDATLYPIQNKVIFWRTLPEIPDI